MKSIIEKIQDILYDYFDYVVMFTIVVAVIAVIGWRLDVLFAKDASDIVPETQVVTELPNTDETNEDLPSDDEPTPPEDDVAEVPNHETPVTEEPIVEAPVETSPIENTPVETPAKPAENIKISIPAGSLPGKIASILADKGLIDNSKNFIAKAVELKLDTKLKSGDYRIVKGSSYEEILKVLTK